MPARVVISNWVHPEVIAHLSPHAEVVSNPSKNPVSRDSLIDSCAGADALIAFMPDAVERGLEAVDSMVGGRNFMARRWTAAL